MKRRSILAVVAIAMLCATPVFAAEIEWKPLDFYETGKAIGNDIKKAINGSGATIESETTQEKGGASGQQNNVSVSTIENSEILATKKSQVNISNISNTNAKNNVTVTKIKNSTVLANDDSSVNIGNIK